MGGEHPDFAFKLETYRTRALAFDAIVEAELEAFEAQLANPTSTSTASTHAVPAASAGPSPGPSSSSLPSSSATKHSAAAAEVASSAESQQAHTDSSLTACGSSPSGAMDGSAHAAQVGVESSALDASMQAQTPPMQKATGADAVEHLVPALEQVKVSASG